MLKTWVQPLNEKNYPDVKRLGVNDTLTIKKMKHVSVGDTVIIYLAKPSAIIKYVGVVSNDNATGEDPSCRFYTININTVFSDDDLRVQLHELKDHFFHAQPLIHLADSRLCEYLGIAL